LSQSTQAFQFTTKLSVLQVLGSSLGSCINRRVSIGFLLWLSWSDTVGLLSQLSGQLQLSLPEIFTLAQALLPVCDKLCFPLLQLLLLAAQMFLVTIPSHLLLLQLFLSDLDSLSPFLSVSQKSLELLLSAMLELPLPFQVGFSLHGLPVCLMPLSSLFLIPQL